MRTFALILLSTLSAFAAQPRTALLTICVTSPSVNTVVYRSTLLGSQWSEFKSVQTFRTTPASVTAQITPGTYRYQAVTLKGTQQSQPSKVITVKLQ